MASTQQQKPQLILHRPDLLDLPRVEIPAGYEIRTFREGDEAAWNLITVEAFPGNAAHGCDCASRRRRPAQQSWRPHTKL